MKRELGGERLVGEMADGGDVGGALAKLGMTPRRGVQALRSRGGREAIRARLVLGRVQAELLAARFAPHAISRLIKLMGEEKPEVGLKAALSVLEAGLRKEGKGKKAEVKESGGGDAVEMERLVGAMVEVMRKKRGMNDE